MYKYWCQCCHSADMSDVTFTTVIPNMAADPSTVGVAGSLPPSYSSIFRNDAAFAAEASPLPATNNTANALYPCPPRPVSYQRSEAYQCTASYQRGNLPSSYQSNAYPYPVAGRVLERSIRTGIALNRFKGGANLVAQAFKPLPCLHSVRLPISHSRIPRPNVSPTIPRGPHCQSALTRAKSTLL